MKIFSVYNNYISSNHRRSVDWIILPDSALLRSGKPVYLPGEDGSMDGFPSLCIKIGRLGKGVAPQFAQRYFSEVAPAIQFMPVKSMNAIMEGIPPKGSDVIFDGAVMVGDFIPLNKNFNLSGVSKDTYPDISISASVNKEESVNVWDSSQMILSASEILSAISEYNTIKIGDLLLVALNPAGLPAKRDDSFKIFMGDSDLLSFKIK